MGTWAPCDLVRPVTAFRPRRACVPVHTRSLLPAPQNLRAQCCARAEAVSGLRCEHSSGARPSLPRPMRAHGVRAPRSSRDGFRRRRHCPACCSFAPRRPSCSIWREAGTLSMCVPLHCSTSYMLKRVIKTYRHIPPSLRNTPNNHELQSRTEHAYPAGP